MLTILTKCRQLFIILLSLMFPSTVHLQATLNKLLTYSMPCHRNTGNKYQLTQLTLRNEGLVWPDGAVVCLSAAPRVQLSPCGQSLAAQCALVPLARGNQLPLPTLQSAVGRE